MLTSLKHWTLLVILAASFPAVEAPAQEAANQASIKFPRQRVVFKNVAAVRGKSYGEARIVVLATGQPATAADLQKARDKDAEDNLDGELNQTYLKAVFREDGTLRCLVGQAGNSSFTNMKKPLEGSATIADGRIRGTVSMVLTGDFAKEVAFHFDVPIDAAVKAAGPARLDPPVKPSVSGKYLGDGKASAIKHVSVREEEPFSGKPAVALIFTEKDHSAAKNPSFDAAFGKFGSALLLRVHYDGGIFGCEVRHSAHGKPAFSSLGQIHMQEFQIEGGNVTGHVSTGGTLDTFGMKWEVDLKFAAPMPEKLRLALLNPPKPPAGEAPKPVAKTPVKAPAGPVIAAQKLPFPKDAKDIEFKKLVEHIQFSSGLPVSAVANEFSARLKEQGWKNGAGGVMGVKNAILKRELGEAKLTIMIKPLAAGSEVKIFTDGLDWTGVESTKPKRQPADEDPEAEAKRLLEEALKRIPKGF